MLVTKTNVTYVVKIDYGWEFIPGIDIWIVSPRNRIQVVPGAHTARQICIGVPYPKAKKPVLKVWRFTPCSHEAKNVWSLFLRTALRKNIESLYYNLYLFF